LVANNNGGDLTSRVAEVAQRASTDRVRYEAEINKLQELLEETRAREQITPVNHGAGVSNMVNSSSTDVTIKELEAKNALVSPF
jgi:hypothetical protein